MNLRMFGHSYWLSEGWRCGDWAEQNIGCGTAWIWRDAKLLIVHADDVGMTHAVNAATIKALGERRSEFGQHYGALPVSDCRIQADARCRISETTAGTIMLAEFTAPLSQRLIVAAFTACVIPTSSACTISQLRIAPKSKPFRKPMFCSAQSPAAPPSDSQ